MATIELSHKELTLLNFCLAAASFIAERDEAGDLKHKVNLLYSKIQNTIDNNYNDRKDDNDGT